MYHCRVTRQFNNSYIGTRGIGSIIDTHGHKILQLDDDSGLRNL